MNEQCQKCGATLCMIQRDQGLCQQCKDGKEYRTLKT